MEDLALPPLLTVARKVGFALGTIAISLTVFRLWDRFRTARLWWDDCWASISALLAVAFMTSFGIYFDSDPTKFSRTTKMTAYYLCASLFYSVSWSARTSILFTIIRLQYGRVRTLFGLLAILFGVMWVVLMAQLLWTCEGDPSWKYTPMPQCTLGNEVAVAQLITTVFADAVLVAGPLWMVYRSTGLKKPQKIRLAALFSTSLITTAVSLTHAYLILRVGGVEEGLAAILEACISLIVANLSVLIALFFRITTEDVSPRETNQQGPGVEVVTFEPGDGGIAPVLTHANLTSLFRGGGPRPEITSTFMTEGGKVRVVKANRGADERQGVEKGGSLTQENQSTSMGGASAHSEYTQAITTTGGGTEFTASVAYRSELSV